MTYIMILLLLLLLLLLVILVILMTTMIIIKMMIIIFLIMMIATQFSHCYPRPTSPLRVLVAEFFQGPLRSGVPWF